MVIQPVFRGHAILLSLVQPILLGRSLSTYAVVVMNMGYRWRRMYYLTGLPGWMRFGYSPGWVGRSPTGLPPTAEWIISSGLMPQYRQYLTTRRTPPGVQSYIPRTPVSKEEEIRMLEEQAKSIESQLEATKGRLEGLRKSPSVQEPQAFYPPPYGYQPVPYVEPSPEEELASLEDYRKYLDEEAKGVEARIEELRKLREGESSD